MADDGVVVDAVDFAGLRLYAFEKAQVVARMDECQAAVVDFGGDGFLQARPDVFGFECGFDG